jgi:hypothetical protein
MRPVGADVLSPVREAIDAAGETDRATFVRRTRNAVARAVVEASLAPSAVVPAPAHAPPADEVRALVGDELGAALVELYGGGDDWTTRAIDVLEPLHALARAS